MRDAREDWRHFYPGLIPTKESTPWLARSAAAVSETINPGYARIDAEDARLTGESHSYLLRDDRGEVLSMTHHFTASELAGLHEAAFFLHATCRTPTDTLA